ncbi:hypothetical protein K491DRAFT_715108 [Lophiostoma macrostomum CBS 122681]|uniref:Uncharacterized protein n=1 Tax=Lophiostoma macrostomum CBS 122681 TaxID=1314788 RepID=A0A6A6TAM1_9PLEO|nr:hypothetical protein K491DRAFT_715108 [Lophiostoma macrostomum CBS 122681]
MCHWGLRVWKCGDSFFTKCSPCSFDRAVRDPSNLLNPLHPSITPFGKASSISAEQLDTTTPSKKGPHDRKTRRRNMKNRLPKNCFKDRLDKTISRSIPDSSPCLPPPKLPSIDLSSPRNTVTKLLDDGSEVVYPRDTTTGKTIPIPVSEIGKGSSFGHQALGEQGKCNVFEVVSQTKEETMCPACARSPKRARLPAHARGCFGLS